VVETGGLENRFALTGNGGSNPSPSAIPTLLRRHTALSRQSVAGIPLRKLVQTGLQQRIDGEVATYGCGLRTTIETPFQVE
jgi:hypothetical protein